MILMFIKRWGLAPGCEDCSLVDWKVPREGAEELWRRREWKGTWCWVCSQCSLCATAFARA